MGLTFELVGRIAVWMFIAEVIVMLLFKKSGKQFKWRYGEFTAGLNSYIKKSVYILTVITIFIVVGLIQDLTTFIDISLLWVFGNTMMLYLMAFSFDVFFIARELAGMSWKNAWVKYPLGLSIFITVLAIVLKFF